MRSLARISLGMLGLALVAKIIDDHGGVIEFDSQPRRTQFRVMLPKVARDGAD